MFEAFLSRKPFREQKLIIIKEYVRHDIYFNGIIYKDFCYL